MLTCPEEPVSDPQFTPSAVLRLQRPGKRQGVSLAVALKG